jgi:hypothetical protein
VRREVFLGAREISKTDFFSFFQRFSDKTFILKLYKSTFRKTGLILFNLEVVYAKIKEFDPKYVPNPDKGHKSNKSSEPAFITPLPCPIIKYITPITNTQRRRGSDFIQSRFALQNMTPIVLYIMEKLERGTA